MADQKPTLPFDHHDPAYRDNWKAAAIERATKCPVAWTEAHGGYWILSKYEDVTRAAANPETFSSAHATPEKPWAKGVLIPEAPYAMSLSESDPPVHPKRRMLEAPFFSPKAVREWAQVARRHTDDALDDIIEKGELDFAHDLAFRAPAKTALEVIGIDPADWKVFAMSAHKASLMRSDDPDYPIDQIRHVQTLMRNVLADRKAEPRDDVITALVTKKIDGELLDDATQIGMLSALVFGGFGTTAALINNTLLWLEDKPEVRRELAANDALMETALEEFLRFFPPNHGTARNVARDVEVRGHTLKERERVLLSWVGANHDPDKFECPHELRIGRPNAKEHLSFGSGGHRCLGAPLARVEVRTILKAVFTRLPDYRIDRSRLKFYPSFGNTSGIETMPARFTPGTKVGS